MVVLNPPEIVPLGCERRAVQEARIAQIKLRVDPIIFDKETFREATMTMPRSSATWAQRRHATQNTVTEWKG